MRLPRTSETSPHCLYALVNSVIAAKAGPLFVPAEYWEKLTQLVNLSHPLVAHRTSVSAAIVWATAARKGVDVAKGVHPRPLRHLRRRQHRSLNRFPKLFYYDGLGAQWGPWYSRSQLEPW